MLSIRLLTIEDQHPEEIYGEIHTGLQDWLFVKKNLVSLDTPRPQEQPWVTNLADWQAVIGPLSAKHDLTFCTVDLKIPEHPDDPTPDVVHGRTLVTELMDRAAAGVRCCILTGLGSSEVESLLGDSIPDVLFDFKGDQKGFPNIVNYIRSQSLLLMRTLRFPGSNGEPRVVLLDEKTGTLRDHYLSKAVYFIDPATWHIPVLLIGTGGLGARTLMEFVAYLGDAELSVVDLDRSSPAENRQHLRLVEKLVAGVGSRSDEETPRFVYVAGVDRYRPGINSEEGENLLWPLRRLLEALEKAEPGSSRISLAFSVSGDSRLRIRSAETRAFLRFLEEGIGRMTGFPLEHLGMDESGWTTGHPRILRMPSLKARGDRFLEETVDAQLGLLGESLVDGAGDQGQPITLSEDVFDLLLDKTDWSLHGNLTGLYRGLKEASESLAAHRAEGQHEITRTHLGDQARGWLEKEVFNFDNVSLSFPQKGGGRLEVIEYADFSVERREMLVILGPSGCGKSTILKLLGGLLKPSAGKVTFHGDEITGASARVGMVFQDYSLFPWLTVSQNVRLGPQNRGEKRSTLDNKVQHLLEVSKLSEFEDSYPSQLSGGMRQRVAIVRALANEPEVLLMDEPFGALDLQTRWQMQDFLLETKKRTKCTAVFVTHDIEEAVFLADRIFIASPRPLVLGRSFVVPFSPEARCNELRRDPTFVALVNKVRDALLEAASTPQVS